MDNSARTAEYLARMSQRRRDLQAQVAALLPPKARFVCEFGCGHGHFLAAYAAAHRDQLCIGLDISGERIGRAVRKRDRAKLGNLHFIHAEARDFMDSLPPDAALADIYILFPDPWPKRRHHKNRLMEPEFLTRIAQRAGQGSRLFFRTDFEPYFREAEAMVQKHPAWQITPGPWPFEQVTVFQSRAERHHSLTALRR
jgi:tRNA (guanine-N7-)-methyltransferase